MADRAAETVFNRSMDSIDHSQVAHDLGFLERAAYPFLWVGLVALAAVAIFVGTSRAMAEAYTWLEMGSWLVPSALFVLTALLSFPLGFRHRAAALLSLSMLLVASTNFMALLFWPATSVIKEVLSNIGWAGLIATLLIFPRGVFVPRWSRWLLAAAALFFLIDVARVGFMSADGQFSNAALLLFAGFFAASLVVLAVRMSKLKPGLERQQLDWLFGGFFTGIVLIVAPLCAGALAGLLGADDAYEWFVGALPLLVPLGFSCFAGGLIIALSGHYLAVGRVILGWSVTYGSLTLAATAIFGIGDLVLEDLLQRVLGEQAASIISFVAAFISSLLLKPLHGALQAWTKKRFAPAAAGAA